MLEYMHEMRAELRLESQDYIDGFYTSLEIEPRFIATKEDMAVRSRC